MPGFSDSRTRMFLRVLTAIGLGVDAYVHADLAGQFDGNTGSGGLSQGNLFRIEAAVASLAALLILVHGRRLAAAFALVVAASALAAVLVTRYYDIGAIGPLPDMYDPAWYTEKTVSAIAEAFAVVTSASLLLNLHRRVKR
ncbi:MAG TPA: hypothetical protein VGX23_03520 [Actinocrinis sp.]|nr:hypothetical protein [Actinocrinis sp.]